MESLWQAPKLISETVKRSICVATGQIFAGFSVATKPTFTCVESTGCIPEVLGSTIRPKPRKILVLKFPWRSYHCHYG